MVSENEKLSCLRKKFKRDDVINFQIKTALEAESNRLNIESSTL
jgi:hypothetical protein